MSDFPESNSSEEELMAFEENDNSPAEEIEAEKLDTADSEDIIDESEEDIDLDELNKNKKSRDALKIRRKIEDHIEEMRLRKEFDYLFDDDFTQDDE